MLPRYLITLIFHTPDIGIIRVRFALRQDKLLFIIAGMSFVVPALIKRLNLGMIGAIAHDIILDYGTLNFLALPEKNLVSFNLVQLFSAALY